MKWLEIFQIASIVFGVIITLFGWPLKRIVENWAKEREQNTKSIDNLKEKVYENERNQGNALHKHDVDIAELKSGKVSHEQLREAVTEMREAMRSSVENISHRWDKARQEDKEELNRTLSEMKEDIKAIRDNK